MTLLKLLHITTAVISGLGFLLRGIALWLGASILQKPWIKILPHIIDTLLLVSAIGLVFQLQQYPLQQTWLTAKVVALILYIILGTIALKRGKTPTQRAVAFALALVCFSYILAVANSRDPVFFLHFWG